MDHLKRVTEIGTEAANSIKGGKSCSCSCSCSCAQSNTSSATTTSEKDSTTLNTYVGH
ncbi:MAG: hypothetical protein H6Q65_2691 [Firmicutes bacterium]|nr:hypothetical protein [Bacillota bacterium]